MARVQILSISHVLVDFVIATRALKICGHINPFLKDDCWGDRCEYGRPSPFLEQSCGKHSMGYHWIRGSPAATIPPRRPGIWLRPRDRGDCSLGRDAGPSHPER